VYFLKVVKLLFEHSVVCDQMMTCNELCSECEFSDKSDCHSNVIVILSGSEQSDNSYDVT
jgi:hypothetical protein